MSNEPEIFEELYTTIDWLLVKLNKTSYLSLMDDFSIYNQYCQSNKLKILYDTLILVADIISRDYKQLPFQVSFHFLAHSYIYD